MRANYRVLDDLHNVQSRDQTSLKKASVSKRRTSDRVRTKIASRPKPFGMKKLPPIEPPKPPESRRRVDTSSTCGCSWPRQYSIRYSATTLDCNCTMTKCRCWR